MITHVTMIVPFRLESMLNTKPPRMMSIAITLKTGATGMDNTAKIGTTTNPINNTPSKSMIIPPTMCITVRSSSHLLALWYHVLLRVVFSFSCVTIWKNDSMLRQLLDCMDVLYMLLLNRFKTQMPSNDICVLCGSEESGMNYMLLYFGEENHCFNRVLLGRERYPSIHFYS